MRNNCGFTLIEGRLRPIERDVDACQPDVARCRLFELQRSLELSCGVLVPVFQLIHLTQGEMGVSRLRQKRNGFC